MSNIATMAKVFLITCLVICMGVLFSVQLKIFYRREEDFYMKTMFKYPYYEAIAIGIIVAIGLAISACIFLAKAISTCVKNYIISRNNSDRTWRCFRKNQRVIQKEKPKKAMSKIIKE